MNAPQNHSLPSIPELVQLAAERPERTVERFNPNDFYGDATILKRYAGLPDSYVIPAVMPHGPSFCSKLWDLELRHPLTQVLAISEEQAELYRQQAPHKRVQVIGSPFLYAVRCLGGEFERWAESAHGTLAFPTHSTHHLTVEFNQTGFIDYLRTLPAEMKPVHVCLYWRDIQLGRHQEYLDAGFPVTTAGHMFDREFLPRLARILASYRFSAANKLGSCCLYAAALGRPVSLFTQETRHQGSDPQFLRELSPSLDLPTARDFLATSSLAPEQAAAAQRAIADRALGRSALLLPGDLRALLEELPGQIVSPASASVLGEFGNFDWERSMKQAVSCLNQGKTEAALEALTELLRRRPEQRRLHYGRAIALARLGRYTEAESALLSLRSDGQVRWAREQLQQMAQTP